MILFSGHLHKLKKRQIINLFPHIYCSGKFYLQNIMLFSHTVNWLLNYYYKWLILWDLELVYLLLLFISNLMPFVKFLISLILLPIFRNTTTEWDILSEIIMSHLHNQLEKTRGRTSWLNLCNLLTEFIILRSYLLLMS